MIPVLKKRDRLLFVVIGKLAIKPMFSPDRFIAFLATVSGCKTKAGFTEVVCGPTTTATVNCAFAAKEQRSKSR
jgi:hypothetical protein